MALRSPAPAARCRIAGMKTPFLILAAAAAASTGLAGCSKPGLEAPFDKGVCFQFVPSGDNAGKFNKISEKVPSLEYCAAYLEGMRQRFLRLGGNRTQMMGAYQGQFIFLEPRGIFTAPNLKARPYLALVRTGDGRLAVPGAVPEQPTN